MIIIIYRENFTMSLIGYARVSTSEGKQLLDRQVDALTEIGCGKHPTIPSITVLKNKR